MGEETYPSRKQVFFERPSRLVVLVVFKGQSAKP